MKTVIMCKMEAETPSEPSSPAVSAPAVSAPRRLTGRFPLGLRSPSPWVRAVAVAAAGTVLSGLMAKAALAQMQSPAAELREAIEQKHAINRAGRAAEASHRKELQKIDRRLEAAKKELELLKRKASHLEASKPKEEEAQKARPRDERLELLADQAHSTLTVAREIRQRIAAGFPYRKTERLARIDKAIRQLESDAPLEQLDGVSNLWALLSDELRLGHSVELYNEPVALEDGKRRVHAHLLRVGLVFLAFASETGDETGLATPEGWKTQLGEKRQDSIRRNVRVLRRRTPPEITAVPFWLPEEPK